MVEDEEENDEEENAAYGYALRVDFEIVDRTNNAAEPERWVAKRFDRRERPRATEKEKERNRAPS